MSDLSDEQREAFGMFGNDGHPDKTTDWLVAKVEQILADALREQREGIAAAIRAENTAYDEGMDYAEEIARNYCTKEAE